MKGSKDTEDACGNDSDDANGKDGLRNALGVGVQDAGQGRLHSVYEEFVTLRILYHPGTQP